MSSAGRYTKDIDLLAAEDSGKELPIIEDEHEEDHEEKRAASVPKAKETQPHEVNNTSWNITKANKIEAESGTTISQTVQI